MKPFFSALAGTLTAIAIAAVVWPKIFPACTGGTQAPKNGAFQGTFTDGTQRSGFGKFSFTGTLNVPEPLRKNLEGNPANRYEIIITPDWTDGLPVVDAVNFNGETKFPYSFRIPVDTVGLKGVLSYSRSVTVKINICFNAKAPNCEPGDMRLSARTRVKIEGRIDDDTPMEIPLGDLYFTKLLRFGQISKKECAPGPVRGTVVATESFLKNAPKGKKLLLVLSQPLPTSGEKRIQDTNLVMQRISASKSGANFSFPSARLARPDYYTGAVALCENSQSDQECAEPALGLLSLQHPQRQAVRLVPESLRVPHCADTKPARFLLYWPPESSSGTKPVLARELDPSAPAEIVLNQDL